MRRPTLRFWLLRLAACVGLCAAANAQSPAGTVRVAAASDLQAVFTELASGFERSSGIRAIASFGSSGNFVAQIRNGAPFDVFMSADADYPRALISSGHAESASLVHYGVGHLVVWTRKDSGIAVTGGLRSLTDAKVRRIAIANPDHAPYGRAAVAALKSERLYDAVRPRLVLGDNISQTAQLADSGSADAAIIALSLAVGSALSTRGTYVLVPATAYPPLIQSTVIVTRSGQREQARRFLAYLQSPQARELFRRFGFGTPPPVH